jgi:hypothetical protein
MFIANNWTLYKQGLQFYVKSDITFCVLNYFNDSPAYLTFKIKASKPCSIRKTSWAEWKKTARKHEQENKIGNIWPKT